MAANVAVRQPSPEPVPAGSKRSKRAFAPSPKSLPTTLSAVRRDRSAKYNDSWSTASPFEYGESRCSSRRLSTPANSDSVAEKEHQASARCFEFCGGNPPNDRIPNLSSSLMASWVTLPDSVCPKMTPPSSSSSSPCNPSHSSLSEPSSRNHPHSSSSPSVVGKNPDRLNGSSLSIRGVGSGVTCPVLACLW